MAVYKRQNAIRLRVVPNSLLTFPGINRKAQSSPFSEKLSAAQIGRLSEHSQLSCSWWLLMRTLKGEADRTSLLSFLGPHGPFHLVRSPLSMTNSDANVSRPTSSQLSLFQQIRTLGPLSSVQLRFTPVELFFFCCRHNFLEYKTLEKVSVLLRRISIDRKIKIFQNGIK